MLLEDVEKTAVARSVSDHYVKVSELARKIGHDLPAAPTVPDSETRILCARLVMEEALELVEALGVQLFVLPCCYAAADATERFQLDPSDVKVGGQLEFSAAGEVDLGAVANEAADSRVVATFAMALCGIADESVQSAVDNANLAKFGPGGYKDPTTGKWVKPKDHKKPDFSEIIRLQREGK